MVLATSEIVWRAARPTSKLIVRAGAGVSAGKDRQASPCKEEQNRAVLEVALPLQAFFGRDHRCGLKGKVAQHVGEQEAPEDGCSNGLHGFVQVLFSCTFSCNVTARLPMASMEAWISQ